MLESSWSTYLLTGNSEVMAVERREHWKFLILSIPEDSPRFLENVGCRHGESLIENKGRMPGNCVHSAGNEFWPSMKRSESNDEAEALG
jgi:hypothetical protein